MTNMPRFTWSPDTASERVEAALKRADNDVAAKSVFTKTLPDRARKMAASATHHKGSPLAGALVSVKALFDVEGKVTTAGTKVLQVEPAASSDAPCIAKLADAGATFVGLTNMSEFAYSGLGLNPHFGTPENPIFKGCLPGGSTSGGAVSVALGLCDIAIGSDTGGSLRIPAAFCGIVGFKPSQATVSMEGGKPLSDTLDSFGPMATSLEACELAWRVMAGLPDIPVTPAKRQLVIGRNFGFNELDPAIAEGFEALCGKLTRLGWRIVERPLDSLELFKKIAPWHLTSVESRAHYETYFQNNAEDFDPRVHSRMTRANEISAVDYRQTLNQQVAFSNAFAAELGDDLLILPTTANLPPTITDMQSDEAFNQQNLLALRNPSLANGANGCSIALPFKHEDLQLSAMLVGANNKDETLLACAKELEADLH
ncbi:amidase family protein [Roseibium algae]|uniref:Amidase family protein n=1 Tax=Roseibium algae TaxID=3123038 RepID=A0ABU8TNI5_9HYPH